MVLRVATQSTAVDKLRRLVSVPHIANKTGGQQEIEPGSYVECSD